MNQEDGADGKWIQGWEGVRRAGERNDRGEGKGRGGGVWPSASVSSRGVCKGDTWSCLQWLHDSPQ